MGATRAQRSGAAGLTAVAMAALWMSACSLENAQFGLIYNLYTNPQPDCPRLNWRFVVDPKRIMTGSISIDSLQPIANLSGMLNADDTFRMTATAVDNGWRADVSGRFQTRLITVSVSGPGAVCDGHTFKWFILRNNFGAGGGVL